MKFPVPMFVVSVGPKCSLRCKDCANFVPYLAQALYDLKKVAADLERLARFFTFDVIHIQGGEPFLHPEIGELVAHCLRLDVKTLQLATNGVANVGKHLEVLKHPKIVVRISDYQLRSATPLRMKQLLDENGIKNYYYKFALGTGSWNDMGGIDKERDSNDTVVSDRFRGCAYKKCVTLENGVVGRCARATVAHLVQKFTPDPKDLVDVRSIDRDDALKEAMVEYFTSGRFAEACRYCHGSNGRTIAAAIQLTGSRSEWKHREVAVA